MKNLNVFVKSNTSATIFLSATLLLLSILLRSKDLFLGGTLWWDEAMLADNIISRDFIQLLKPLNWFQTAPIGFLFLSKITASIFSYSDIGFRLLPYIFGTIQPLIYFFVLKKATQDNFISFIASLSICLNPYLLFYSSEFKPYIFDSLLGIGFILFVTYDDTLLTKRFSLFFLSLFFIFGSLLFSSYFILSTSIIIYLILFSLISNFKPRVIPLLAFVVSAVAINYFLFAFKHPYTSFMYTFWSYDGGFIVTPDNRLPAIKQFYWFSLNLSANAFGTIVPFQFMLVLLGAVIISFVYHKKITTFLILPPAVHFICASLKIYPLAPRLMLLWIPFIIFLVFNLISPLQNDSLKKIICIGIFLLIFPFNQITEIVTRPLVKCTFEHYLSKIPKHSTVCVSRTLIPMYNVCRKRGSLDSYHLNFITSTAILGRNIPKADQVFGITEGRNFPNITSELAAMQDTTIYLFLHLTEDGDVLKIMRDSLYITVTVNIFEQMPIQVYTRGHFFPSVSAGTVLLVKK